MKEFVRDQKHPHSLQGRGSCTSELFPGPIRPHGQGCSVRPWVPLQPGRWSRRKEQLPVPNPLPVHRGRLTALSVEGQGPPREGREGRAPGGDWHCVIVKEACGGSPPPRPPGSPTFPPHTPPPRQTTHVDLSGLASFQNVTEKQKACETDLAKAEPALLAAQEALDTLNKVGEERERNGDGGRGSPGDSFAAGSLGLSPGSPGPPSRSVLSVVRRTT